MSETDYMLWNGSEKGGNIRVIVRRMKALMARMETVTLIGKGGHNLIALCIKLLKLLSKYFFLADVLVLGGCLRFG